MPVRRKVTLSDGESASDNGRDRISEDRKILGGEEIKRALTRVAHEILERNGGAEGVVLVGLHTRGVPLARRLSRWIGEFEDTTPPVTKI